MNCSSEETHTIRTLLIDGDILVVSTGAALEKETHWGDDEWTLHCDVKLVKSTIMQTLARIERDLEADKSVVYLSQGSTFRHEIYPDYKKGRGRKPVGTNEVKRWLIEEKGAQLKPGIEADDAMGIVATHPRLIPGEKIIVSADKDMLTIPGKLYRMGEVIDVTPEEAQRNWLIQALTGDVTDGYPGCPGVGPKKAEAILNGVAADVAVNGGDFLSNAWGAILNAYEKAGFDEEYALTQTRLARILHHTDYDFKRKEVILWQPST